MSEISTSSEFKLTTAQDRAMDVLISDATHAALGGGSRSGKTFLLVRAVIIRALKSAGSRHSILRFRFNAIKSAIIYDTLQKVSKLCFPELGPINRYLNKTDWFLKLPNESEIWFGGLDDKERVEKILGNEYATMYFNEASQIPWQSIVLALTRLAQKTDNLRLKSFTDFNPPSKKHWTYMRFIEKRNPETKQPEQNPLNFGFYLINPEDNKDNLDPEYLNMLRSLPEKARKRFLLGQFADESEGQLWTEELLAFTRRLGDTVPEMSRIVVAVDPSGCEGPEDERSDEVGIVVCGLGIDGHGYLLEDLSGRYGPKQWATIVDSAFQRHRADKVIGEKNFGGAMVEAVLQAENPDLPYKDVNASRGKTIRAEPISTLYEQGKIHHVGFYPEMEDQMCAMTVSGYQGLKSPDRADAAVHGFTELFPMLTRKAEDTVWVPPTVHRRERSASRFEKRRRY